MPLPYVYNLIHHPDAHYGKFVHSWKYFTPKYQTCIAPILFLVGCATTAGVLSSFKHMVFNPHVTLNHKNSGAWNHNSPVAFDFAAATHNRSTPEQVFSAADEE